MAMQNEIKSINIESISELNRINLLEKKMANLKSNISLRINPEVSLDTHPYLETGSKENKFGISLDEVEECVKIIKNSSTLNLCRSGFSYWLWN